MYKEENMIRISQLKLPVTHKKSDLEKKIYTTLKISSSDLLTWHIEKKSLDARKKPNLFYVYTIAANIQNEKRIIKKNRNKNITIKDVGDTASFLFSDMSKAITAEVIHVDSGFSSVGV